MDNQIQLYHDTTRFLLDWDLDKLKGIDKRLRQRYQEGYQKGYQEAKNRYLVTHYCSICGGKMEVEHDNAKKAIRAYMKEHGWGHTDCIDRDRHERLRRK